MRGLKASIIGLIGLCGASASCIGVVLLEANPLEDNRNTQKIYAVVLNGQIFDREALDELLAAAERAAQEQQHY